MMPDGVEVIPERVTVPSFEFVVRRDVNELSPNARMNRFARARLVKEWRTLGKLHAMQYRFSWKGRGRLRISFLIRRGHALDDDNASGSLSLKALTDGLVDAGLVPDDSPKYVERGEVTQETGKEWKDYPQVIVRVEEVPG